MHDTSALWKQILSEPDHRKEVKVTINGNEYGENRIVGVSVSGGLFDAPGVGNAVARTLELNIMPLEAPFGLIPPMSEIRCFVRLVSADGQRVSEYIQKGVFYADTVTRDSDTGMASVTAFDAIMRMNQLFGKTACTVTYDDGFGNIQKFECDIGDAVPTVETPSRDDLDFIGWNPVPEGVVVRDTLFLAQWQNTVIASGSLGNDVRYTLYKNGLLEVSGSGNMRNYSADWSWGYFTNYTTPLYNLRRQIIKIKIHPGVTGIGAFAFGGCGKATEIEIPDSVTYFSEGSFAGCGMLKKRIEIPNKSYISRNVFYQCYSLEELHIPDTVTWIGYYAFYQCYASGITIPKNLKTIEEHAFEYSSIKEAVIPDSVTQIASSSFRCSSLSSVTIPNSVTSIAYAAFEGSDLTSVTIPGSAVLGMAVFRGCTKLVSAVIENGVTSIPAYAFANCGSLTNITIPPSVSSIGANAFAGCTALTDVYYGGTEAQRNEITTGNYNTPLLNATWHCIPSHTVTFTSGGGTGVMEDVIIAVTEDVITYTLPENGFTPPTGSSFFGWISSNDNEYAPGDTITLESDMTLTAIWQTANLIWTIRDGVLHIGGSGNMENYSPDSPPPWHDSRDSVTSVIMYGVTSIGDYAFYNCANLAEIQIPASVSEIGDNAFAGCSSLANVYYNGSWYPGAITIGTGNEPLYPIRCGNVSILGQGECGANGDNLTWGVFEFPALTTGELEIKTGLMIEGIGAMADYNVDASAPWYAYRENIQYVIVADDVTSIGNGAFRNCSGVMIADFTQSSITSIGDYAFSGCTLMMAVGFPDTLTNIGDYAFQDCSDIEQIVSYGTEEQRNAITIGVGNEALNGEWQYMGGDNDVG